MADVAEFEEWYRQNRNYYHVAHAGDEEAMVNAAMKAHTTILEVLGRTKRGIISGADGGKKKKSKVPNPYGFK